jgi:hypothetical protein
VYQKSSFSWIANIAARNDDDREGRKTGYVAIIERPVKVPAKEHLYQTSYQLQIDLALLIKL